MSIISTIFRNRKYRYFTIGGVLILAIIVFFVTRGSQATVKTVTAQMADIKQVVSATGRVVPAENVDLAFQGSGKVVYIGAKPGDTVRTGQMLVELDISNLKAQEIQAKANVDAAQAKLNQVNAGNRPEDINVAQTNLANAQKLLNDIKTGQALITAKTALNTAVSSVSTLDEVSANYPVERNNAVLNDKESALQIIYGEPNLGQAQPWYYLNLNGGLKGQILNSSNNPAFDIRGVFTNLKTAMAMIQNSLNIEYALLSANGSDVGKTALASAKSNVLAQISAIENQEQTIVSVENSVANAKAQLELQQATGTSYDVQIAQSQLTQAQGNLQSVQAIIAQNIIYAPFAGVIARLDTKEGGIVQPGKLAISLISNKNFEIEADIAEADIARVKTGDTANVTVDAYGTDISWTAKVISIDPGEKIIDGVATYRTVLEFDSADTRIRSGMTANLDILNATRNNVLTIPQRVVIRKDSEKIVQVFLANADKLKDSRFSNLTIISQNKKGVIVEVPVTLGLQGSDGKVEVLSGLKDGDAVVTN